MKKTKKVKSLMKVITILISVVFLLTGCGSSLNASNITKKDNASSANDLTITDLADRKVQLPKTINKISAIHPIPSHMVWRLAPKKMASIDSQFKDRMLFMSDDEIKRLKSLPMTGVFNNGDMSTEQMLTIKPDIIISLKKDTKLDTEQQDYQAPIVATSKDSLTDYEDSWRIIGKITGNEKEGNELGDYWHSTVGKVTKITSKIPQKEKLKVYYAQSGTSSTVGTKTIMASIIRLSGGINLYDDIPISKSDEQNESINTSMEQILSWNPDVIIAKTGKIRDQILSNPQWQNTNAVKNKRVYATLKYEMLDRIQSLMGLVWTADTLYPDKVKIDLHKETKTFYSKVYLTNDITDTQIDEVLN
ncbi:MAG: ABC transporter substrate-binding protein [Bacillota bacterium]|nr:ABC transporter substrate-binding protein [Bacillota bacterium]